MVYNPWPLKDDPDPVTAPGPIRKAVFPAAGMGTRFLPATKAQPKEMLPLVDKPIIQYVIEEAVAAGLTNIIIVTGRGKNAIEDHFDTSYELEKLLEARGKSDLLEQVRAISNITVSYVRQGESLGLGHAVLVAKDLVGDEPFAVLLGDDIIDSAVPCMRQMVDVFERKGDPVIAVYKVVAVRPAGDRLYLVTDLVEKPSPEEAPSDLAIIGRYILTPDIFAHLEKTSAGRGGEIQLTDGLRSLLRRRRMYAYRFHGTRYDTGDKLGFLKATVEFALRRPDLGAAFRAYLKSLDLDGASRGARRGPRPASAGRRPRRP